jgi:hypothetical protein
MDNSDNEIFERLRERILSLGFSDDATKRKLDQYALLREEKPRGLSALDISNIAEDLMTSFLWVANGERDPFELRSTARNVLRGIENDEPGSQWLLAKNVFSDIITAYQQVSLGPSDNFKWSEPRNIDYAVEKLRQLGEKIKGMPFFEVIEKCFGVEIIVLDRAEDFTAIGAKIGGAPVIVVKQGMNVAEGSRAAISELGRIMADDLYWYSDVYENGADSESWIMNTLWVLDMTDNFMNTIIPAILLEDDTYTYRRFPKRLIEAHRKDVAAKKNLGYFLEWMEK